MEYDLWPSQNPTKIDKDKRKILKHLEIYTLCNNPWSQVKENISKDFFKCMDSSNSESVANQNMLDTVKALQGGKIILLNA
jgi:hypothetical protein